MGSVVILLESPRVCLREHCNLIVGTGNLLPNADAASYVADNMIIDFNL